MTDRRQISDRSVGGAERSRSATEMKKSQAKIVYNYIYNYIYTIVYTIIYTMPSFFNLFLIDTGTPSCYYIIVPGGQEKKLNVCAVRSEIGDRQEGDLS